MIRRLPELLKLFVRILLVFLRLFVCIGCIFSVLSEAVAQNCPIRWSNLPSFAIQGLSSPTALQDVVIGPFQDGREVRLQLEYLETREGIKVFVDKQPKCIQIDRLDFVRSTLALDAIEFCNTAGGCSELSDYFDFIVGAEANSDFELIDQTYRQNDRGRLTQCVSPSEAQNWLSRTFESVVLLQFHEIGHSLMHAAEDHSYQAEAEADGFAVALAELLDLELTGSVGFLAPRVVAERNFTIVNTSHPPSECRLEAIILSLRDWYAKRPHLMQPAGVTVSGRVEHTFETLEPFLPTNKRICERYEEGFHTGVQKALELVDPNVAKMTFLYEGFGRRCTAFE